jgi:glyoxylase-like metal-dependent hydrolase (beta-lactamase superfamily II)
MVLSTHKTRKRKVMTKARTHQQIQTFSTTEGASIHQLPLEVFPGFWAYAYLVLVDDLNGVPMRVLIDTGSGFGDSNDHLEAGLKTVSEMSAEEVHLGNLTHILITHGHIDHFGGLSYVRPRTPALLGVHELDRRNLTNYEERLTIVARRLNHFFVEAGVSPHLRDGLLNMYTLTKSLFRSVTVDFTYEAAGMQVGPFDLLHVPGHCAGHVVIRLHDVLFSGDHVLEGISPHQAPEHLTLSTGLAHYLQSLETLEGWAEGVNLTLGGHKNPVTNLLARLNDIRALHRERLDQVLDLLVEPSTISEVSRSLFGEVQGYNILLALEEAGAHVEYLYQRGLLGIDNLAELENATLPIPILYQRL